MSEIRRALKLVVALAAIAGSSAATPAVSGTDGATGTLNLRAELRSVSQLGQCPPGVSAAVCATRTGQGAVPGLGSVSEQYTWLADIGPPSCGPDLGRTLTYPVRFVVAGKGEIDFTLAEATECVDVERVRTQTQAFTITGGTGIYRGASGSGTVERTLGGPTASGSRAGQETWTGTLTVPALEFDLTPPTLTGAVGKAVRAPRGATRVRVLYRVSARDDVDGLIPVACRPRSGSRFRIGRTVVTCTATDSSGNAQTARFVITVRPRR